MSSFFEKLKKGMGVEGAEEPLEEKPAETIKEAPRKRKISVTQKESAKKPEGLEIKKPAAEEPAEILMEKVGENTKEIWGREERGEKGGREEWPTFGGEAEGQLAIDVYQTETDLVIQSAIAGVRPENLDITLEKDILTIKGIREKPFSEQGDYFSQECYWGLFSREIILPAEVDPNQSTAKMKEGVLTIRIPKILREKKRKVIVTS